MRRCRKQVEEDSLLMREEFPLERKDVLLLLQQLPHHP